MPRRKNKLLVEQLDNKIFYLKKAKDLHLPTEGWVHTIRTALSMSLRQLGIRLGISPQGVKVMEEREKEGSITINTLQEVAKALNMKLVYGFVPLEDSVQEMINKRALELAREIVMRTSMSMKLEDQENSKKRIEKAIKERAEDLISETPKLLWR